MKASEHNFSLTFKKEGKNPKNWVEMKTVEDIFNYYKTLSKKDAKKMMKQFADSMEVSASLHDICVNETEAGFSLKTFKYCND